MAMQLPGRDLRHPRRRRGPDLPAPRERDRPVRGGQRAEPFARVLAAQRDGQHATARRCPSRSATCSPSATLVTRHDPAALAPVPARHALPQPARAGRGARRRGARALDSPLALVDEAERMAAKGTHAARTDGGLLDGDRRPSGSGSRRDGRRLQHPGGPGVLFDLARVLHGAREQAARAPRRARAFVLGRPGADDLARRPRPAGARRRAAVDRLKARVESPGRSCGPGGAGGSANFERADRDACRARARSASILEDKPGTAPPGSSGRKASRRGARRRAPLWGRNPVRELLRPASRRVRRDRRPRRRATGPLAELLALAASGRREGLLPHARAAHRDRRRRRSTRASWPGSPRPSTRPRGSPGPPRPAGGAAVLPGPRPGAGPQEPRGAAADRRRHRGPRGHRAQAPRGGPHRRRGQTAMGAVEYAIRGARNQHGLCARKTQERRSLDPRGGPDRGHRALGRRTFVDRSVWCSGARGRGYGPWSPGPATSCVIPMARAGRIAERLAAASRPLLRSGSAERRQQGLDRKPLTYG